MLSQRMRKLGYRHFTKFDVLLRVLALGREAFIRELEFKEGRKPKLTLVDD